MDLFATRPTGQDPATHSSGNGSGSGAALSSLLESFRDVLRKSGALMQSGSGAHSRALGDIAGKNTYEPARTSRSVDDRYRDRDSRTDDPPDRPRGDATPREPEQTRSADRSRDKQLLSEGFASDSVTPNPPPTNGEPPAQRPVEAQVEDEPLSGGETPTSGVSDANSSQASTPGSTAPAADHPSTAQAAANGSQALANGSQATAKTTSGNSQAAANNTQASTPMDGAESQPHANGAPKPAAAPSSRPAQVTTPQNSAPGTTPETANQMNPASSEQAAVLARNIGRGNQLSIQTQVSRESETVVSQPASNLSASTVILGNAVKPTGAANATMHGQADAPQSNGALAGTQPPGFVPPASPANTTPVPGSGTMSARGQAGPVGTGAGTATTSGLSGGADAMAAPGGSTGASTEAGQPAAATRVKTPQRPPAARSPVVDQVSVQITKALKAGVDRIHIQLKPASMGRVDVQMEIGFDGRVNAVVTADNKETLDLLQRDARDLQKALQDAGFDTDSGSLNFSLRGENGGESSENALADAGSNAPEPGSEEQASDEIPAAFMTDGLRADGRIDIRA